LTDGRSDWRIPTAGATLVSHRLDSCERLDNSVSKSALGSSRQVVAVLARVSYGRSR
jgi:hypothetical protein